MAKLANLPEASIVDGFKGTIDFYVHDGVPCARKWPRSPGPLRAAAVMATWAVFSDAVAMWNTLSPAVRQAYNDMAAGTPETGRDLFTRGYMIGLVEIIV